MRTPSFARPVSLLFILLVASVAAGCATSEPAPPPGDGDDEAGHHHHEHEHHHHVANATDTMDAAPAPLPERAGGVAIDQEKGYYLEDLGAGLYFVTDGVYQTIFATTGEGVIIVDAPPNLVGIIPAAIAEVTGEAVTHVIYTHTHADHISAAASLYPEDATYIAHEATAAVLADQGATGRVVPFGTFVGGAPVPQPTVTFSNNHTLTVGNQTLELAYHGPTHEPGNIFVYAPAQKVLLLIDVIFPGWVPFLELAVAEDVPAYVRSHDQVLAYDFEVFVGGHIGRYGDRADVERQRSYIHDVRTNAMTALQTVDFNAIAAETGFENPWHLFGTYLEAVASECARLTEETWVGELGGADLFTHSHCAVMVESLRID